MKFDDSFFEGDMKENFYVRPMIKRVWAAQMELLEAIDMICKKHQIMYFADWGTLLGAVRHHGFIPWDDDLDIGMRREDYERFLFYAQTELPEGMEILNFYTDAEYQEVMSQVRNGNKIDFSEEFLQKYHGCPYVVGVDIFPKDYIPRNKEDEETLLQILTTANVLAQNWNSTQVSDEEKQRLLAIVMETTGYEPNIDMPMSQQLYQISDKLCALYSREESDEITQMCVLAMNRNFRLPLHCYDSTIDMPFEHITIPVPMEYNRILKLYYGENYMTPVKQRGGHDYPFFRKQEERLRELFASANLAFPDCFAK